jgi:hypothetical protein
MNGDATAAAMGLGMAPMLNDTLMITDGSAYGKKKLIYLSLL